MLQKLQKQTPGHTGAGEPTKDAALQLGGSQVALALLKGLEAEGARVDVNCLRFAAGAHGHVFTLCALPSPAERLSLSQRAGSATGRLAELTPPLHCALLEESKEVEVGKLGASLPAGLVRHQVECHLVGKRLQQAVRLAC